jgi:hypothetical protein
VARHGAVIMPTHTTDGEIHQPTIERATREATVSSNSQCQPSGFWANLWLVSFRERNDRSASPSIRLRYVDTRRHDSRSASPKKDLRSVSPMSTRPICAETSSSSGTSMIFAPSLALLISYRNSECTRCQAQRLPRSPHLLLLVPHWSLQKVRQQVPVSKHWCEHGCRDPTSATHEPSKPGCIRDWQTCLLREDSLHSHCVESAAMLTSTYIAPR